MGQIMQSFQLDLKNFHYSLCEIQLVFLFFSSSFFKYFILIFCLLLITNLFKVFLSGGDWILTPEHSVSCHCEGRVEEKKRKKGTAASCRLWGSI